MPVMTKDRRTFEDLTDEEIAALKSLLPHANTLIENAKIDEAKSILWKRWKGILLSLAAVIGAITVTWDWFLEGLRTILK